MSDEQRLIPEFLSPYLTQEQYDRAREYLKTPHTRVDLSPGEWDDLINGRGWPKDCWTLPDLGPDGEPRTIIRIDELNELLATKSPSDQETKNEETK
jgi:hypothetical protein